MTTSDAFINVGDLVTTNSVRYGYYEKLFQSDCNSSTLYIGDTEAVEKGSIGIVIQIEGNYTKVLWSIDRQAIILFMHASDVILLDIET